MNKQEQQLFLSFFEELLQTEQIINELKIDLALTEGFNPNLLFNLISDNNENISIQNMRLFLSSRIVCSHRELYEVFQRFDWGRNGFINRQDFIKQITPFGREPLFVHNNNGIINSKIQGAFIAIFIEIIKRFRIVQVSRKQIVFIQPYAAFQQLDHWKKGIIGLGQLERFYQYNDFQIGESQLFFLLHALRRRCYRDVNLEVFCENLNPLQFGEYMRFGMEMEKEGEIEYLKRSRNQDELIKRSRIQAQKLQHQAQRYERRRKAEIERQINLQDKINLQLLDYERSQDLNVRRKFIEQEQKLRSRVAVENQLRKIEDSRRIVEQKERSIQRSELQLEAAKRQALRQKQLALQQQIGREIDAYRTTSKIRQLEASRREIQLQQIRERQRMLRDMELSKYRPTYIEASNLKQSIKQSRISELEKQLEKTRAQMKERRNRLDLQQQFRKQYSMSTNSAQSPY